MRNLGCMELERAKQMKKDKGVTFEKRANKFRAYCSSAGKQIKLGYYSNYDDALKARQAGVKFYQGYKDSSLLEFFMSNYYLSLNDAKSILLSLAKNYFEQNENIPFPVYAIKNFATTAHSSGDDSDDISSDDAVSLWVYKGLNSRDIAKILNSSQSVVLREIQRFFN